MERATILSKLERIVVLFVLFAGSIAFIVPFYVTVAMSLKSETELATTSMWSWPQHVTFANYVQVLTNPLASFPIFLKNTIVITVISTIGTLFGCTVVSYAFARMNFAGRD